LTCREKAAENQGPPPTTTKIMRDVQPTGGKYGGFKGEDEKILRMRGADR